MKKLYILIAAIAITQSARSQDTSYVRFHTDTTLHQRMQNALTNPPHKYDNQTLTPHIYRDTRLGSSSPLYNTYKKNHYGAGAITTNPNKWGSGGATFPQPEYSPAEDTLNQTYHPASERNMTKRDGGNN